jgi:hypothetical protein
LTPLWLLPLSLKQQHKLLVACEIIEAWSTLDVFIVSLIAALMEIGMNFSPPKMSCWFLTLGWPRAYGSSYQDSTSRW